MTAHEWIEVRLYEGGFKRQSPLLGWLEGYRGDRDLMRAIAFQAFDGREILLPIHPFARITDVLRLKEDGVPLERIHEEPWSTAIRECPYSEVFVDSITNQLVEKWYVVAVDLSTYEALFDDDRFIPA